MFSTYPIVVSTGFLNTVNDTTIAADPSIGSRSRKAGQLGKAYYFEDSDIGQMFDSTVGTLYAGLYRYVGLDADSGTPAVGEIAYWNQGAGINAFEVTRSATPPDMTSNAVAGVFLNALTPGNYGFIFVGFGIVDVLFGSSITGTARPGRPVFVSTSAPNRADIIDTDPATTPIFNQYLGTALETPVANTLSQVNWFGERLARQ